MHSGGGPGFSVQNVIYPDENLSFAFVANGTDLPRDAISDMLAAIDWRLPDAAATMGCGRL